MFTNNIHGAIHEVPARFINPEFSPILSGGAGAYTYVNQLRKEAKKSGDFVLLTDAGNFFQGTQLGTEDGGSRMIRWMNWMKNYQLIVVKPETLGKIKENYRHGIPPESYHKQKLLIDKIKPHIS